MRVHVIAVAGTGMGPLAGLLRELGHDVSGSDTRFDPPMGPALGRWGVRCLEGFRPEHLQPAPDLVVVGNVCRSDNPEARAAIDGGLPYTHIAGALQRFVLEHTRPLVVAGTHGKTTTTAIAAWLLDQAGQQPGFLVGGLPRNFARSFRAPRRARLPLAGAASAGLAPFVIEGDEYDTAFFEKTAKFLHYRAKVAIITSIEHDHIDIYPTPASYEEAFARFIASIPADGVLIANAADAVVRRLVQSHAKAAVGWYALQGDETPVAPHWMAAPAAADLSGQSFDLYAGGTRVGRFAVPMHGTHNLRNALAAVGAAAQGFGAPVHSVGRALAAFEGIARRQEVIGRPGGVVVYDDFAHHPTAVRETLSALRRKHPQAELLAVFEPRSATACRRLHQAEYATAFDAASAVLIAPLGREGLPVGERLDREQLATDLRARGRRVMTLPNVEAIVEEVVRSARPGDVVAVLSNGAFQNIHQRLLAALAAAAAPPGKRVNGSAPD